MVGPQKRRPAIQPGRKESNKRVFDFNSDYDPVRPSTIHYDSGQVEEQQRLLLPADRDDAQLIVVRCRVPITGGFRGRSESLQIYCVRGTVCLALSEEYETRRFIDFFELLDRTNATI